MAWKCALQAALDACEPRRPRVDELVALINPLLSEGRNNGNESISGSLVRQWLAKTTAGMLPRVPATEQHANALVTALRASGAWKSHPKREVELRVLVESLGFAYSAQLGDPDHAMIRHLLSKRIVLFSTEMRDVADLEVLKNAALLDLFCQRFEGGRRWMAITPSRTGELSKGFDPLQVPLIRGYAIAISNYLRTLGNSDSAPFVREMARSMRVGVVSLKKGETLAYCRPRLRILLGADTVPPDAKMEDGWHREIGTSIPLGAPYLVERYDSLVTDYSRQARDVMGRVEDPRDIEATRDDLLKYRERATFFAPSEQAMGALCKRSTASPVLDGLFKRLK